MEVTIIKLWNFTATFRPKSNSTMCCKSLAHPSHQEVKSCKILNQSEYQQITTVSISHGLRPDLHTALKPGRAILQDLNQTKFHPIRTVSTRLWAKTRFAYSSGTRKCNPARSQIEQILQPVRTVPIRS